MKNIDDIYIDFIEKLKSVLLYISDNFGNKEILNRKNQGLIQSRNLEIKNSIIKGYIFHGSGCDFRFKHDNIDVEFENDSIGFTEWSFYSFANKYNCEVTDEVIKEFLNKKTNSNELRLINRIYEIN